MGQFLRSLVDTQLQIVLQIVPSEVSGIKCCSANQILIFKLLDQAEKGLLGIKNLLSLVRKLTSQGFHMLIQRLQARQVEIVALNGILGHD